MNLFVVVNAELFSFFDNAKIHPIQPSSKHHGYRHVDSILQEFVFQLVTVWPVLSVFMPC